MGENNVRAASGLAYRCPRSSQCYQTDRASTAHESWST